ncbi:MAG: acetyl-CoA carboxylase biotin carboxyl carrier protein subunit [Acidobacteria bacterium]|nr:acetyl-CoA carboxylase biotin carboxyl carrier protein subunit [Acidobacteriota bacterium]
MRFDIEIGGRTRQVVVTRTSGGFMVSVDGAAWPVNVARIDRHTLSLLIDRKVRLTPDPTGDREVRREPDSARNGVTSAGVTSVDVTSVVSDFSRTSHEVTIVPDAAAGRLTVRVGASLVSVGLNDRRGPSRKEDSGRQATGPQRLVAAMPGKVVRVLASPGDVVRAGQGLIVLEAMKMENELRAPRDGTVTAVHAREGMSVDAGTLLVVIA